MEPCCCVGLEANLVGILAAAAGLLCSPGFFVEGPEVHSPVWLFGAVVERPLVNADWSGGALRRPSLLVPILPARLV